jgi:protein tyrosine phosphatase
MRNFAANPSLRKRISPERFFNQSLTEKFPAVFNFKIFIAIMIAIENLIRIDQTLIFHFQPDSDFNFSIRVRLKNFQQTLVEKHCSNSASVGRAGIFLMYTWLTFCRQTLMKKFSAESG